MMTCVLSLRMTGNQSCIGQIAAAQRRTNLTLYIRMVLYRVMLRCYSSIIDFVVYVRSLVEYNSVIWSPHNVHERVQSRFRKQLPEPKLHSYAARF